MSDRRTIKLDSGGARKRAMDLILRAPMGYAVTIGEETRSQEQNRLMWPLIADMQAQDAGMAKFTPDQVKLRFLHALDSEMQFLPEIWGSGHFAVGQRSSTLTKADFSMLLELMFKWGAENNIQWSHKSEQTRETLRNEVGE